MKKILVIVFSALIATIACSQTKSTGNIEYDIIGKWYVENPAQDYQGTKEYVIKKISENRYSLFINNAVKIDGILISDELAIHYQITGFGPDGPEEKIVLSNGKLISYYLENNKWVKMATFYRTPPSNN